MTISSQTAPSEPYLLGFIGITLDIFFGDYLLFRYEYYELCRFSTVGQLLEETKEAIGRSEDVKGLKGLYTDEILYSVRESRIEVRGKNSINKIVNSKASR